MERKLNKKKIIGLILIILIMLIAVVSTILYRCNPSVRYFFDEYIFRKNITENTLPKILINNKNAYSYENYIVYLENNKLTFYNKSGSTLTTLDIEVSEPIFEANGNYLCVAEKNGSKIYLLSNKNIVWQQNIEGKVSNLTVNKNGYVAVSISDTPYETICKLYNNDGVELFTTYLSTSYVVDAAISNDNKYLALAEINFSGIAIQSNVKIVSIDKALSNSSETIQYNYSSQIDEFIVNLGYSDNSLICVYDNHIDIIKDNSVNTYKDFEKTNILFADINNKLVLIEKRDTGLLSSEFELQIIDVSTNDKTVYKLDREPKSLNVFGNIFVVNFGTEALFINNSGWLIKKYTSSQEIQDIVLSNDLAGIIFKDKVEILSL